MKKILLSVCCLIAPFIAEAQSGGRIYDECNDLSATTWNGGNEVVSGSQSDWIARQGDVYRYALSGDGYSHLVYQIPNGLNVKSMTVDFYSPTGLKPTFAIKNSEGTETKYVQGWSNGYPVETTLGGNVKRHHLEGVASFGDAKEAVIYIDGGSDVEIMRIIIEYGDGYTAPNYNENANYNRTKQLLAKAASGEDITIGIIGGSITAGANAEPMDDNCYGAQLKEWFESTYSINVNLVNAGIGSTNSYFGAIRAEDQLLRHNPDLVVVEYAVNDKQDDVYDQTYEGILRKSMKAPGCPAVIALMVCTQAKKSATVRRIPAAQYYEIPVVSYTDAISEEIIGASKNWLDYYATSTLASGDGVHPNTAGHQKIADLLSGFLQTVTPDASAMITYDLPAPLYSSILEDAFMLLENNITAQKNGNWADGDNNKWLRINPGGKGWRANTANSELVFDFVGDVVAVTYWRRPDVENHGTAEIWVDDNAKITVDSKGDNLDQLILSGLGNGAHKLHIKVLENKYFEISSIAISGDRDYFNSSKNIKAKGNGQQLALNNNAVEFAAVGEEFQVSRTSDGFLSFKAKGQYLSINPSGDLILSGALNNTSKFLFVDKGDAFALRSVENGKYLSVQSNILKATASTVSANELFTLLDEGTVSLETSGDSNKFTFDVKGNTLSIFNAKGKAMSLFDLHGREVFTKAVEDISFSTSINNGIYLLRVGEDVSKIVANN